MALLRQMQPLGMRGGAQQRLGRTRAVSIARPGIALARTQWVRRSPIARRVAMPEAPAADVSPTI